MKSVTAFAPSTMAPATATHSLHMAAGEASSRREFAVAALAATSAPGWFANFDSHSSGCQCGSCAHSADCACGACARNSHSAGCACGACAAGHNLGCACANCMTSGPFSSVVVVSFDWERYWIWCSTLPYQYPTVLVLYTFCLFSCWICLSQVSCCIHHIIYFANPFFFSCVLSHFFQWWQLHHTVRKGVIFPHRKMSYQTNCYDDLNSCKDSVKSTGTQE